MIEEIFSLYNFFQLSYELQTGDKDTWLHSPLQVVRTQLEDHTQPLVGMTDKVHLDSHLLAVLWPSDFDKILDNLAAVVVALNWLLVVGRSGGLAVVCRQEDRQVPRWSQLLDAVESYLGSTSGVTAGSC